MTPELNEEATSEAGHSVAVVVMAAGAARRFGRPKQLERWPAPDGPALVQRAVALALQVAPDAVYVVTGNQQESVRELLAEPPYAAARLVYNERWAEGQGFSVAAGVRAVQTHQPTAEAILFMLADQPRLTTGPLTSVLTAFTELGQDRQNAIIFPVYNGKRGNPVLFGRAYFGELAALEGDTGGRAVVKAHPQAALEVAVNDPAIHEDVDEPNDLAKLGNNEAGK